MIRTELFYLQKAMFYKIQDNRCSISAKTNIKELCSNNPNPKRFGKF